MAKNSPNKKATPDVPSTLRRSPAKAQRTYEETLESAEDQYGDEARAHRVAWGAVKHSYEKTGDHWEAKDRKGPSDAQSARPSGRAKRDRPLPTAEGVDANASKAHLLDVAARLEVRGRTRMTKDQLVDAIKRANRRQTAAARR
ncbi:ChaB family protein [Acidiferrimicrobium sp. IK]|uniref:ChaB family protein n=1 Tax=Acidiferrimicrobium sp. IK TaxID=2871700 RepID=UPI0021CB55DF|nr:ChaB family protein [Acidiferrimicrobium sp. IK]MCU4187001.1 ChaB family protein [Acidiferrimicrobium sp. IK]